MYHTVGIVWTVITAITLVPKQWVCLSVLEIQPLQYLQTIEFLPPLFLGQPCFCLLALAMLHWLAQLLGERGGKKMLANLLVPEFWKLEGVDASGICAAWWNVAITPLCTDFAGSQLRACFSTRGFLELKSSRDVELWPVQGVCKHFLQTSGTHGLSQGSGLEVIPLL